MGMHPEATLRAGRWAVLLGLVGPARWPPSSCPGPDRREHLHGAHRLDGPASAPGSVVVVRPVDPADIGVGSVITYQLESGEPEVVTHRVVEQGVERPGPAGLPHRGGREHHARHALGPPRAGARHALVLAALCRVSGQNGPVWPRKK